MYQPKESEIGAEQNLSRLLKVNGMVLPKVFQIGHTSFRERNYVGSAAMPAVEVFLLHSNLKKKQGKTLLLVVSVAARCI